MTSRRLGLCAVAVSLAIGASCGGKGSGGNGGAAGADASSSTGGGGGESQGDGGMGGARAARCELARAPMDAAVPVVADPGTDGDGDFTIGPAYADAPEILGRAGVPVGALKNFSITSTPSSIFPGINGAFSRNVTVYVPSQYVPGTAAPFIVVQDGSSFVALLPTILNNLIHDKRIPPLVAILINPGPGDGPGSDRNHEYDTVSDAYVRFIETEVLPLVEQRYSVTLSADPEGRAAMGASSGAAAAFTMGWMCPSLYRRILTYSGTFVNNQPLDPAYPHGAWEYHENLIPKSDAKPLRVFLEVGDGDNGASEPAGGYRNWLLANQGMASALKDKGYHYRFLFARSATHNDADVFRQTLPDALVWLWRGYPVD